MVRGENANVQTRTSEPSEQVNETLKILHNVPGQRETNVGIDNVKVDLDTAHDDIYYGEYKDMFT